jgi:hypothetical protein
VLIKMIRRAPISGAQCPESAPINFTHKTAAAFNSTSLGSSAPFIN